MGVNSFEGDRALESAREERPCASGDARDGNAPPPEDQKRFRALVKRWKEDTGHLSSAARMAQHPAYQEIIRMGPAVVPLLLAELKRDSDFWFAALREITKENPVPAQSAGKEKEMARAWIEWGRKRGYLP
jgi:hypothetical protein